MSEVLLFSLQMMSNMSSTDKFSAVVGVTGFLLASSFRHVISNHLSGGFVAMDLKMNPLAMHATRGTFLPFVSI